MSAPEHHRQASGFSRAVDAFERNAIAAVLGVMTLLTFVSVVVRYVFNLPVAARFEAATGIALPHTILWGQEATLILFAWLVIFGTSHAFRITAHLGVDAIANILPRRGQRILAILAAACCLIYAGLLLKGAWDYWAPFAGLDQTTGRWFPTGLDSQTRDRAFYITEQIPMPHFLDFLAGWINQGEVWDKMPRVIPYLILPIGTLLILLRLIQSSIGVVRGHRAGLIVSHEAEDAVEEVAALNRET